MTALAKHITMKICAKPIKNIKRDKSGNTVTYPKAGKPQAEAALAAGTYPQLNVSSDGWIMSRAACSGGQSPCLRAQNLGCRVCWLAKVSQSGHFTEQHPNSTAVPGVSAALPCSWGTAAYSHVVQQVALFWVSFAHLHGIIVHLSFPLPSSHPQDLTHADFPLLLLFQAFFKMLPRVILRSPKGAACQRFPFLCNVHSLVGATWVISEGSGRSITPLGFLLSFLEATSIIG